MRVHIEERVGAVAGMLAFLLMALALPLSPDRPQPGEDATLIPSIVVPSASAQRTWVFVFGLAALAILIFAIGLSRRLKVKAPDGDLLPRLVRYGALLLCAVVAVEHAVAATIVSVAERSPQDRTSLTFLVDLDYTVEAMARWGIALFMGAAGLAAVLHRALPRWLGWLGLVGSAAGFAGAFSVATHGTFATTGAFPVLSLFVMLIWILAVSVTLMRGSRARLTAPPDARTAM